MDSAHILVFSVQCAGFTASEREIKLRSLISVDMKKYVSKLTATAATVYFCKDLFTCKVE